MTKVIHSQTSNKKYFLTINEHGQAEACTCGDCQFRHHACKHQKDYDAEFARALAFLDLKTRIDNAEREARAAARIAFELSMGL